MNKKHNYETEQNPEPISHEAEELGDEILEGILGGNNDPANDLIVRRPPIHDLAQEKVIADLIRVRQRP